MTRRLHILSVVVLVLGWSATSAQDIPLFTQKLTNSFLYNPSVAGNSVGSLTLAHRQYWSGALDAPSTNFFSAHTPFGNYRYGTGLNFYQDRLGVTQNIYASVAFAYHINITDDHLFSMGLSGSYDNQKLDPSKFDVIDADDPLFTQGGSVSNIDFSFGINYRTRYLTLGASANRLRALTGGDSTSIFPAFYAGTARLTLPLANERDLLEPMVTYRGFAGGSSQIDAGLFYTYNDFLTLGGSYRTGGSGTVTATLGVKFFKAVTIGYSRDIFMGDVAQGLGATNEFTLRYDFMSQAYYTKVKNSRAINNHALSVRRKTLSTYKYRGSPNAHSKHYKNSIKRKSYMSPNYRMDSSKKLQTMRKKSKATYKRKSKPRKR